MTAVAILVLSGCASAPPIGTPSGNPEITLSDVRTDCVKAGLVNGLMNGGYRIEQSNEYTIVASKPTTNGMASMLYGSRMNAIPDERLTITMAPQMNGNGMRLVFDNAYITNPGTAFEKREPMPANANVQRQFESAIPAIERNCAKAS